MNAAPAKWAARAAELFSTVGALTAQRRALARQLAELDRRLEAALTAIDSLEATASLAAELELEHGAAHVPNGGAT